MTLELKNNKGKRVILTVQPMNGAILTIVHEDRRGFTRESIGLSVDECVDLARIFIEGTKMEAGR